MVDERTTSADELEDDDDGTPEGEPAEVAAPEDRPDQPAPGVIAQAEYTRATQLSAAIRKELGLAKGATQAEVIAALQAARAQATAEDEDYEEEDPRIAAATARAYEAELRVQKAVYGEEFAEQAINVLNVARTSDDLDELFPLLASFAATYGQPGSAPAANPAATGEQEPEGDIGMSEGERATASVESTPSARRESGVVSTIRGLFDAAGAASRPSAK